MVKAHPDPTELAKAIRVETFGDLLRLVSCGTPSRYLTFPTLQDYQAWIEMRGSDVCNGMSLSEFWGLVSSRLPDKSAFVPAVSLWKEKGFKTYKLFKTFLQGHPEIHTDNPRPNRLMVHAGDWARYWYKQDVMAFENLDQRPVPSLTPDDELVKRFVETQAQKMTEK